MQVGDLVRRSHQSSHANPYIDIGAMGIIVDIVVKSVLFEVHWFDDNSTLYTNRSDLEIISKCTT